MLFKMRFEVIEVRKNGVRIKHFLNGKKNDVKKEIEHFKNQSRVYLMVGKIGMIVWE